MNSTPEKYGFKEFAKGILSHLVAMLAALVGLAAVFAVVVAVSIATATPSHTPTPPTGHVSYTAHPGAVVTPNIASFSVVEADNVAYITWSDPGAVGVSKVKILITVSQTCLDRSYTYYELRSLAYSPTRNVDAATYQPIPGRKNHGNAYRQYAPGGTYGALITVTNAAGTSQPTTCVDFTVPQTDPM